MVVVAVPISIIHHSTSKASYIVLFDKYANFSLENHLNLFQHYLLFHLGSSHSRFGSGKIVEELNFQRGF